jgi:RimJ/RimL family protein N-acetyltransferase
MFDLRNLDSGMTVKCPSYASKAEKVIAGLGGGLRSRLARDSTFMTYPTAQHNFRIALKTPSEEDDAAVAAMRSHPATLRYLNFLPTQCSIDDARKRRIERTSDSRTRDFHIHLCRGSGEAPQSLETFVGTCGLTDINLINCSAEAGILISPNVHRTGLGSEALYFLLNFAFHDLNLHRVVFETARDNIPMRAWFTTALGIEAEAFLKEAWKCEGGWMDAVIYRILEQEWRNTLKTRLENRIKEQKCFT